jgi:Uncharacterized conserved protein
MAVMLGACGHRYPIPPRGEGLTLTDSTFLRVQVLDFPGDTVRDLMLGDGLYVLTQRTLHKLYLDGTPTATHYGGLVDPTAVAQDRTTGEVYVLDRERQAVLRYPPDGDSLGTVVLEDTNWVDPRGLAVVNGGLIVSEHAQHLLLRYDLDSTGQYTLPPDTLSREGNGILNVRQPWGIFSDFAGQIWVASTGQHWVEHFTATLPLQNLLHLGDTTGQGGADTGVFRHPVDVSGDLFGRVVVADSGNRRLQLFSPDGSFSQIFGSPDSLAPLAVLLAPDGQRVWAGYAGRVERYEHPNLPYDPDLPPEYGGGL